MQFYRNWNGRFFQTSWRTNHGAADLHRHLQTLIILLRSRPPMNKLPFATATYFTFDSSLLRTCCHFPPQKWSRSWLRFHVGGTASWQPPFPADQTPLDSKWVYQSPTGFCHFLADGTTGHLPILKGKKLDMFFICCTRFLRFLRSPALLYSFYSFKRV